MSKDEALKLALDALVDFGWHIENCPQFPTWAEPENHPSCTCGYDTAITAISKALAEPKQAPVTLTEYFKKPYAYVDAVDRSIVYVAPARKLWLKEREDKEWREFHVKHQYDIPLYTEDYNYEQQDC